MKPISIPSEDSGGISGSREPSPAVSALPGFDPGRDWPRCDLCLEEAVGPLMNGHCVECWNEINGQFGVGA